MNWENRNQTKMIMLSACPNACVMAVLARSFVWMICVDWVVVVRGVFVRVLFA